MKKSSLLQEEKNSTVLFSWLFYIVFFVYEIFYYNLFPAFPWNNVGANSRVVYDFMYAKYFIIIALIPFSIYLIKKG